MSDQGSPAKDNGADAERRSRSPSPRASSRERSRSPNARDQDGARGASSNGGADPDAVNPGNNVYVANLPHRLTQVELEETFGKFGRLEKCELIVDPVTRESRGFAFVTFEDVRDAEDAVRELNGKEIHGRRIRVEIAKRRRGHEKTPGKYLGPRLASTKFSRDDHRDRSYDRGARRRSRSRSRSRDRYARSRYDDRDRRYDDRRYDDRGRRSYDRYDDRRRR